MQDKLLSDMFATGLEGVGGMHQGSYLGPLIFIILTVGLRPGCVTHKYIDDRTMIETLKEAANSHMQSCIDDLVK